MSLDSRNSSAFIKRAEQLKRWEESDTNREPPTPKNPCTKIKFSSGCIFLAACGAGDKDEVKQLLDNGADIDTTNIDGLTALHQACIDDNLDMVEFLISQGADVNKKDNEGWTPLHVTASCDILSIARYLIENGADLASINSDGDLPIDLVGSNEMRELIQKHINEQGIDCDEAKRIEEKIMLEDAKRWLRSDASEADRPHPKTGATALHVAAAKGYAKVLSLLLAGRADVDKQDNDGWTPLHAAAHWGQKEACQMLVASLADMDILNFADQSALDVAQDDIVPLLEELKKNNKRTKRRPASQIRISDNNIINNADNNAETPSKVIRIDVKADDKKLGKIVESDSENESSLETDSDSSENSTSTSLSDRRKIEEKPKPVEIPAAPVVTFDNKTSLSKDKELIQEEEQSWRRSNAIRSREKQESPPKVIPTSDKQVPDKENQPQTTNQNNSTETDVILRRTQSFESDDAFYVRLKELRARIKANSCSNLPVPPQQVTGNGAGNNNSASQLNNFIVQRSASLKDHKQIRKPPTSPPSSPGTTQPSTTPATGVRSPNSIELFARRLSEQTAARQTATVPTIFENRAVVNAPPPPSAPQVPARPPPPQFGGSQGSLYENGEMAAENGASGGDKTQQQQQPQQPSAFTKFAPGNIFKNFFKSFVPPTRDEESETQRKAHAKRVRETRRSTQGVTLEEIKSAEQLVKKKNSENESVTTVTLGTSSASLPTSSSGGGGGGTTSNNDRVPSVPPASGGEFLELLRRQKEASPPEQVSASYTIVTPSSLIRSRAMSESAGGDQSNTKVSASYTIAPPSPTAVTTTAKTDAAPTKVTTITATYSVPLPATISTTTTTPSTTSTTHNNNNNNNNNLKKTETETVKSGSPTVKNRFRWDEERTSVEETSGGGDMKAPPVPAQRFQPDFPVHRYVRDKRQIFDLEMSANPLTLAEKLRIEASKYADTTRSSNDLPLSRSESESSDVPKKYDSVPSSPAHHATERRPSWRLRVDAGSKFKLEDTTSKATTAPTTSTTTAPTSVPVIPIAAQRRVLNTNVNSSSFAAPHTTAPASTASSITITSNSRPLITAPTVTSVYSSRAGLQSDEATQPVTSRERHNNDHSQPSSTINSSSTTTTTTTATEVTLPLRQRVAASAASAAKETEENDKENDNRSGQATQGLIQRRRRPKRRSTGVVHLDTDDLDPDGQGIEGDEKGSGGEGRLDSEKGDASENGEFIDYKALYFAEKAHNDQLKLQLNKKDEELASLKAALDRFTNATTKNTLSEIEKRERRAMERKISEMEEELKQMETLKADNQRLKDENGALIRVISKLSK